ncbi:hypothetical protein HCN51_40770 [Nonomuraea sp. FMUSA5-5]|uniref:Uncharacterized protein n=1 Tax=Nonomuraea composti TaxID=2720023 RepID=A0ABX1BDI7_9ACTN|nr:hypothetical protein [Nonomuraea sp. FMUSA5-5]NJP95696.1 hypothetical protein [Nonomuraea sp. FMUSA5-5]
MDEGEWGGKGLCMSVCGVMKAVDEEVQADGGLWMIRDASLRIVGSLDEIRRVLGVGVM